jgi:TonB family protein
MENRAKTDMSLSDAFLSADALDHLFQPASPSAAERRGLAFAVLAAALLHLLIAVALLVFYWLSPSPAPPVEEIPVEVVVERPPPPPPPPPPKPQEKPKPPPEPEDDRPAYDAPSAATQEKANRESPDQKTTAPAPKTEHENPGAPQPSEKQAAAQEKKAASPPPLEAKPVPEGDEPTAPSPASAEAAAAPPAETIEPKPAPPPAPPAKAPPGVPLPAADELPQYQFAHAATESPVVGGNADTRYFTIVYGMIRAHLRRPPDLAPPHGGAIVFTVDESGNLVQHKVVRPSGSPNLDVAVTNAIIAASPYPAPPGWEPRSMRLTYGR